MRRATSSFHVPGTRARRSPRMQGLLLACLLAVGLMAAGSCAYSQDGGAVGDSVEREGEVADAVWFARYTMQEGGLGYVGVTEDGEVLVVEGIGYPGEVIEGAEQVRTGSMEVDLRDRLFRVAADEAVYTARVEGPGELLFYQGVLLRIGSRLDGTLRVADLVPMSGLPQEAREVLEEVLAWSGSLASDPEVRLLLSAEAVDPDRAEGIRSDPRDFYRFLPLSHEEVEGVPALDRALWYEGLWAPVRGGEEAAQISAWLASSNPQGVGSYFFVETPDGAVYQCQTLDLAA